jgi:anti-sigma B factor antagonist
MDVRFDEKDGILVVTPLGARLDAIEAPDFRAKVGERAQGRAVVVLDAAPLAFIDSSGLAALISVLKRMAPGGALRIAGPADAVKNLLRITRLEKIFPSFADVNQALAG